MQTAFARNKGMAACDKPDTPSGVVEDSSLLIRYVMVNAK